jgi:predicted DNA-binding protein
MDSTKISVRLDAETEQRLRQEARSAGRNESEVVRDALAAYFARRRQGKDALTLAQQARVVGCAKGLPPDLSTNKGHFEGFGR